MADAEVKVSKNGKPYLEFRFANNEYGDEDGYTFWVRVSSYNPSLINLAKFYTKGKSLIITGKYKDRAYINKDGKPEVGRDITASAIEFNGETRQNNGENNENVRADVFSEKPLILRCPVPQKGENDPVAGFNGLDRDSGGGHVAGGSGILGSAAGTKCKHKAYGKDAYK